MTDKCYKNIDEYLQDCGIFLVDKLKNPIDDMEIKDDPEKYLAPIVNFHKKTMGLKGFLATRLDNCTGKKVEGHKVRVKKFIREIKRFESNGCNNSFEELVLKEAPKVLSRACDCIDTIHKNGYFDIIERSMKRIEICLGNSFIDNIEGSSDIRIISSKKCCYNMVECDGVYLLNKFKKHGKDLDWKKWIKSFCEMEELDYRSEKIMAALLSFPSEFLKCCERYRYGKKEWDEEEFKLKLLRAKEKDSYSIL